MEAYAKSLVLANTVVEGYSKSLLMASTVVEGYSKSLLMANTFVEGYSKSLLMANTVVEGYSKSLLMANTVVEGYGWNSQNMKCFITARQLHYLFHASHYATLREKRKMGRLYNLPVIVNQ